MNFLLHVDIECNIYIILDRTRGLNVSFKLHVPVPSTQPPAMKSETQALIGCEEQGVIGQSTQY